MELQVWQLGPELNDENQCGEDTPINGPDRDKAHLMGRRLEEPHCLV